MAGLIPLKRKHYMNGESQPLMMSALNGVQETPDNGSPQKLESIQNIAKIREPEHRNLCVTYS